MEEVEEETYEEAFRIDELPAGALMTTKVAPAFNGRTSWFAYEELIEEFLDITILNDEKIGPALRSRLTGDAAVYKPLFDREKLKTADKEVTVEYFKSVLRPHFIKGSQHVFLWRFLSIFKLARGHQEMIRWIGRWTVAIKRLKDSWMDLYEGPANNQDPNFIAAVTEENQKRQVRGANMIDITDIGVYRLYVQRTKERHAESFPMNDNLMTLIFIVMSDLTEDQRERLVTAMEVKQIRLQDYTFDVIRAKYIELYCAPRNSLENPNIRSTGGGNRSFAIVESGVLDGQFHGFWVQDEDTGEEGFMEDTEETFWTYDENEVWISRRVPGRKLRRGKGKGKGKGKNRGRGFRGRRYFRPHSGRPKGQGKGYWTEQTAEDFDYGDGTTQHGYFGNFGKNKGKFGKKGGKRDFKGKGKFQEADAWKGKGKPKGKGKFQPAQPTEGANVASEGTETYEEASNDYSQNDWNADSWWLQGQEETWSGWLVHTIDRTMEEHKAFIMKSMQNIIDVRSNPSYVVMDLGCTKSMGSRPAIMEFVSFGRKNGLTFEFKPCRTLYAFANSQQSCCYECLVVWFPTSPPCHTEIDILEEGNVPILLSLPQMKNLYMTIHLTPSCEYLTCAAFGLDYTPCERSITHHMVLDLCTLKLNPVNPTVGTVQPSTTHRSQAWAVKARPCPYCGAIGKHECAMGNAPAEEYVEPEVHKTAGPVSKCPACEGKHRPHTYVLPGCTRIRPDEQKTVSPAVTPLLHDKPLNSQIRGDQKKVTFQEPSSSSKSIPSSSSTDRTVTANPEPQGSSTVQREEPTGTVNRRLTKKTSSILQDETSTEPHEDIAKHVKKMHDRLEDRNELLKLHLKHYHMSMRQFKLRTSELKLPSTIYAKYQDICDKCETCQKHKPAPPRSRVSGLRAVEFGDLVFIDHGSMKVDNMLFQFLILLDAATMFIQVYAVVGLTVDESTACVREYMDTFHCKPRTIVGDSAFQAEEWQTFYRRNGIKLLPVGRYTPWPNRAEAAVRLFKRQFGMMITSIQQDPDLSTLTPREIMKTACFARNTNITYGGKTPVELVFGRRPRDIVDPETSTIEQLTTEPSLSESRVQKLRNIAMKAHLEARQSEDLRRDLASSLRFISGEYSIGDKCWLWFEDRSKIKVGIKYGKWERVTVIATEGSMVTVNSVSRGVMRINQSKLRKDADEWYDVDLPFLDDTEPLNITSDRTEATGPLVDDTREYASILWEVVEKGKLDFVELFSGSARLSAACASSGLRVGQPVDLKTGFDLNTRVGQKAAMKIILEQQPEVVFLAPLCSPWCSWSNMKAPEDRDRDRANAMPMVIFCAQVATHQIKNGRYFILENPERSQLFNTEVMLHVCKHASVKYFAFDHCEFGMKDPESGKSYKKGTILLHNFPEDSLLPLERRCSGKHAHQPVEGSVKGLGNRSKLSQVYTFSFCKRVASCLLRFLQPSCSNRQSYLISDLLDMGDFTASSICHLHERCTSNDVLLGTGKTVEKLETVVGQLPSLATNAETRQRMNVVNALAAGTDINLHYDWSTLHDTLVPVTKAFRKLFFPNQNFDACRVLRGTIGEHGIPLLQLGAHTHVLMWKKRDVTKIYVGVVQSFQWHSSFSPMEWSMIVYFNEGVGSKPDDSSEKLDIIPDPVDGEVIPPLPSSERSDDISSMSIPDDNDDNDVSFEIPPDDGPPHPPDAPSLRIAIPDVPLSRQPFSRSRTHSFEEPRSHTSRDASMNEDEVMPQDNDNDPDAHTCPQSKDAIKVKEIGADIYEPHDADDENDFPHPQASSSNTPPGIILPTAEQDTTPIIEPTTESSETITMESDRSETGSSISTIPYSDAEADLIILEDEWNLLTEQQKILTRTGSFSIPRTLDDKVFDVKDVPVTPSVFRNFYSSTWATRMLFSKDTDDIHENMRQLEESDRSLLVESLKATYKPKAKAQNLRSRKEASSVERRQFAKQFNDAKQAEYKSWVDNDVFELVDSRKLKHIKNYVTGRWVLTLKKDKDGNFVKCKARWVLRGFQDTQKDAQQTDSPAATRPGFRLMTTVAANNFWDLKHIDLKTAFLQGETFDTTREILCQLPPEAGNPPYIVARMKRPAYGLNDAPRRWFNVVDRQLRSYGLTPTRADRCCYVLYKKRTTPTSYDRTNGTKQQDIQNTEKSIFPLEQALEYLQDPIHGSPAKGKTVSGIVCLHVDDLYMAGDASFFKTVITRLKADFQIGSEDSNDIEFCGQRIKWKYDKNNQKTHITVDQNKCVDELNEIVFDKSLADGTACNPTLHTSYRSVLGMLNWLQSRTQFQIAYSFSRCASAASAPTIGHVRTINKLVRQVKSRPVMLHFWPLSQQRGPLRILAYPDASYRNNEDKSSQMAQVIFVAESRVSGRTDVKGTLIDYESHKIKRSTQSTTVAELSACMRSHGHAQFIRGLYMDLTGDDLNIHVRTDANNLVTTAKTTHLPEQKDTIHMITMLRKECGTGSIHDLSHIRTEFMLADSLTKSSAKPDNIMKAVETGYLPQVDTHPPFRSLLQHKAYLVDWCINNLKEAYNVITILGEDISLEIKTSWFVA